MPIIKKLIDVHQDNLINCDHCDYVIPNETGQFGVDVSKYINYPCPKCGENLLTEDDYRLGERLEKSVMFINKWFSWLTVFRFLFFWIPKRNYVVKTHEKITINEQHPF